MKYTNYDIQYAPEAKEINKKIKGCLDSLFSLSLSDGPLFTKIPADSKLNSYHGVKLEYLSPMHVMHYSCNVLHMKKDIKTQFEKHLFNCILWSDDLTNDLKKEKKPLIKSLIALLLFTFSPVNIIEITDDVFLSEFSKYFGFDKEGTTYLKNTLIAISSLYWVAHYN